MKTSSAKVHNQYTNFIREVPVIYKGASRYWVIFSCVQCKSEYRILRNGLKRERKRGMLCRTCGNKQSPSEETKKKISSSIREKLKDGTIRQKMSQLMIGRFSGAKHWNWQGGRTSINQRDRSSPEYSSWRSSVFVRDNFTCIICNTKGGKLHAHHVKPWAIFETLRFNVDNGITVCAKCHGGIHKYLEVVSSVEEALSEPKV